MIRFAQCPSRRRAGAVVPTAAALLLLAASAVAASAEPLALRAVLSPKEQIYVDVPTPQKHFVLFARREGRAAGGGALDGAQVTEYGMHDIRPGVDGAPRGYLVMKVASGDQAVVQWEVQATFIPGPDGRPRLLDNGVWRFIGGTGALERITGAGTLHIKPVSPTDREFQLEGEVLIVRN